MKQTFIIGAFIAICAFSFSVIPTQAAKVSRMTPATHMWVLTGNAVVHVYADSLEQCQMLTAQAAAINSSESDCYNDKELLARINCQKNPVKQRTPNCTVK